MITLYYYQWAIEYLSQPEAASETHSIIIYNPFAPVTHPAAPASYHTHQAQSVWCSSSWGSCW